MIAMWKWKMETNQKLLDYSLSYKYSLPHSVRSLMVEMMSGKYFQESEK